MLTHLIVGLRQCGTGPGCGSKLLGSAGSSATQFTFGTVAPDAAEPSAAESASAATAIATRILPRITTPS